jgi:hypothetical protein
MACPENYFALVRRFVLTVAQMCVILGSQAREMEMTEETRAYYAGRNSVDFGTKCEFNSPELVKAWREGRRSALAEDRLDMDTEWD